MTEREFTERHRPGWRRLEQVLDALAGRRRRRIVSLADVVDVAEFDREYRRVCKHLALARQRLYGSDLVDYLNQLVLRANRRFYGKRRGHLHAIGLFVAGGFPALVREHRTAVLVSAALFLVPAVAIAIALRYDPGLVYAVMDAGQVHRLEAMYEPGANFRPPQHAADSDMAMFGFYVWNNIGLGFRTFAAGALFGVGAIFIVAVNGLVLGAVASHLHRVGYGQTFVPFVAGHSGPELTGLVLSGAAGLTLGWSLISPGRRSRLESLRSAAARSIGLVYGVAGLLLLAACIEAFWSARSDVAEAVKIAVGAGIWMLTLFYLLFAGRHRGP